MHLRAGCNPFSSHIFGRAARYPLLQRRTDYDLRLRMLAFTHFLRSSVPEIIISPVRNPGVQLPGHCEIDSLTGAVF
jgi:hypothetical protein